jgi:type I restriction enzyme, S subunit
MNESNIMRLSDTCIINPSKSEIRDFDDNLEISFIPMRAVDDEEGIIKINQVRRLGEVRKGYTYFRENDVIFAKITPCMENGKSALALSLKNKIGFGSTEFHVLRARDFVLPEWIYYFVRQSKFRKDAEGNMKGTAGQQRVPTDFIESYSIPVPSLYIQSKIVNEVENSRNKVNAIKTRLYQIVESEKQINLHMDYLLIKILDLAFAGKLVY